MGAVLLLLGIQHASGRRRDSERATDLRLTLAIGRELSAIEANTDPSRAPNGSDMPGYIGVVVAAVVGAGSLLAVAVTTGADSKQEEQWAATVLPWMMFGLCAVVLFGLGALSYSAKKDRQQREQLQAQVRAARVLRWESRKGGHSGSQSVRSAGMARTPEEYAARAAANTAQHHRDMIAFHQREVDKYATKATEQLSPR